MTISFGPAGTPPLHLLLVVPNGRKGPAPVFVGMNFGGKATRKLLTLRFGPKETPPIHLLLVVPKKRSSPAPTSRPPTSCRPAPSCPTRS